VLVGFLSNGSHLQFSALHGIQLCGIRSGHIIEKTSKVMKHFNTPRVAAILGMIATFIGGYILGGLRDDTESKLQLAEQAAAAERLAIPVGPSPSVGRPEALVTVVEFGDFQCPYCARSLITQKRLMEQFPHQIRWVYKHMPLPFHPRARPAASAAMAAHVQGHFWPYARLLYLNQKQLDDVHFERYARELGLDVKRFLQDMNEDVGGPLIEADVELSRRIRVKGTPSYFINGRLMTGPPTYANLVGIVREEIALAHQRLQQGITADTVYEDLMTLAKHNEESLEQTPAMQPTEETSEDIETPPVEGLNEPNGNASTTKPEKGKVKSTRAPLKSTPVKLPR
jgi:protein-disulfide isomerase